MLNTCVLFNVNPLIQSNYAVNLAETSIICIATWKGPEVKCDKLI